MSICILTSLIVAVRFRALKLKLNETMLIKLFFFIPSHIIDINECNGNACGNNAVCINSNGGYDCRCKDGYYGNPFTSCQRVEVGTCKDPNFCTCNQKLLCPLEYTCVNGECVNKCNNVKCGPRSVCQDGTCVCPSGYFGDPHDLRRGCKQQGHCSNDLDCKAQQICFQIGKGTRKCVDGCSKQQCGPNAFCITENHISSCLCTDGYFGNPNNLIEGCQPGKSTTDISCNNNDDCKTGYFCLLSPNGVQECVNPCSSVACGAHQKCETDSNGRAICKCQDNYEMNPVSSTCEKPSVPDCISNDDCLVTENCSPDALGVLKCLSVCDKFSCTTNSQCVVNNHQARCECLPGYTGNPNDRFGCQSSHKNQCTSDSDCPEYQTCKLSNNGILTCQQVCNFLTCGPNALCVVHNHVGNCECPPGLYAGDPNDLSKGCQVVPCVYNYDCPPSQLCNLQKHTCYNACENNSCGPNAVCIVEDYKVTCKCPQGFKPNPVADIECTATNVCQPNTCHPTATCVADSFNNPFCQCPPNHVGNPNVGGKGCQLEGHCNTTRDCPVNSICNNLQCINPCENVCGQNALCEIINGEPICKCIHKFVPSTKGRKDGCVRSTRKCNIDTDCDDSVCLEGQCRGK